MGQTIERNDFLIRKKIRQYAVPAVLTVLGNQLGVILDGIVVGSLAGADCFAAVSLATPVISIAKIAFEVAVSGATLLCGRYIGRRERNAASQVFTANILYTILVSMLFPVLAPFISKPLMILATSDMALAESASAYLSVTLLGMPFIAVNWVGCQFCKIDNDPKLASAVVIASNGINVSLDVFFLKYTGLGMRGVALATVMGDAFSALLLYKYLKSESRMLRFQMRGTGWRKTYADMFRTGVPYLVEESSESARSILLNRFVIAMLGTEGIIIYSICSQTMKIISLSTSGLLSIIPTLSGVFYAEKDYFGIKKMTGRVLTGACGIGLLVTALVFAAPKTVAGWYGMTDVSMMGAAVVSLRIYSASFIFRVLNKAIQKYYPAILHGEIANINNMLEQFALRIPLSIILCMKWGIYGVCAAHFLSESLPVLLCDAYRRIRQKKGKLPAKGFLMIPEENKECLFDCTINSTVDEAVHVSERIIACCLESGIDSKTATVVGVAAEELAVNISSYGYHGKKSNYIDINLSVSEGKLILRVRDDGVCFNPVEYQPSEEGKFEISGILLIKKLADKFTYVRTLTMNYTVVEMQLKQEERTR